MDLSKVRDIQKFVDEADDTEIYDLEEKLERIQRIWKLWMYSAAITRSSGMSASMRKCPIS